MIILDGGLERKLRVAVGDLILLKSNYFEVSGFVIKSDLDSVTLSFENPHNENNVAWYHRHRQSSNPKRGYKLKAFTDYEILEQSSVPQE